MSSINSIIGAVNRALNRIWKKSELRRDSMKEFEEGLLREAMTMAGASLASCLELSIIDLWNKPLRITVDEKKSRQGKLLEVLSIITPHDTPLERFIQAAE